MHKGMQNYEFKTESYPHQYEAIDYLSKHCEVALFDEQGLGKTKIVIDSLCTSMKEDVLEGVLVVSPMSLLYNWELEVTKHSFLIPIVIKGTQREKRYKFLTGANFYITNYEAVVAELERIRRFCRSRKIAIVLDESARIKNPATKTAQSLFMLRPYSAKRIIITGTPVANKPIDLWSQYFFLDGGVLLGSDYKAFKLKYDEKNPNYVKALLELQNIIKEHSIRRCKNEVLELPEKKFINIYATLIGEQHRLYSQLKEELRIEVQDMDGNAIIDEVENILKKLLRLTQIASNPFLVDKGYKEVPAKFSILENLLKGIIEKDEKAIIWTSFVENIIILKSRLKQYCPLVIHGDVPVKDRADAVKVFQDSEKNKIMIANPSAAREGLTLTRANNAIYIDRNFNLVDYLQSQDRIHRISQMRECTIFKILAKGTIDEYIDRVIDIKKEVAGFVQGDVNTVDSNSLDFLHDKSKLLSILG
jgi:SNF2 family DNA or RNA helicase